LTPPEQFGDLGRIDLVSAIGSRSSRRRFSKQPLTLAEVSFLLWATQGVRGGDPPDAALRTVPSAGARHSFETYLSVHRVEGVSQGLYRYLPLEHQLVFVKAPSNLPARVSEACFGQDFAGRAAATFFWTTIPYRMEWRYGLAAHKVIAVDAGHVCQNLYLCCEAIGAGTCAIGAYDQQAADALLGVDGEDEFTIYIAPVGKKPRGAR
jgi:SagB-type dehydrogenase family enzyme